MGTCQGGICASRAAAILGSKYGNDRAISDLKSFLQERWKGILPVAWGRAIVEAYFTSWIYEGVCGLEEDGSKNSNTTAQ